ERDNRRASVLAALVSLARNQYHVALAGAADGKVDRGTAVRLDDHVGAVAGGDVQRAVEHLGQYAERILRPRVITGENRDVGQPGGGRAHHRALGPVPVTAAAQHDREVPLGDRAQRLEHGPDRTGLV